MSTKEENYDREEDPVATVLAIEHQLYNMGKALACPLCLSTLKTPTLLPCNHAFCKHCITEYFDPKHNRKIDSASGKHSFKNNCPICKTPASKRGITESTMLVGLVRAYKQALRSFGQTPVVYDETIAMTQIEDTVCFSQAEDDDDETGHDSIVDSNIGPIRKESKKKGPTLRDCHQHLEVSRGVHNVLKRAVDSLATTSETVETKSSGSTRLAEMEKQNKLRRLNNLLMDQEKVVKVNEKALVRAAVSKQKKKSDSVSSSIEVSFENNVRMENDGKTVKENEMDNAQDTTVDHDSDDETTMGDTNQNEINDSFTQNILDQAQNAIKRGDDLLKEEHSKPEETCHPQISENNSQTFFSAPEPEPINFVEKDEIMTSQECYERAMEDARENEAADRSYEWLDKENEVLTQDIKLGNNDARCSSSTPSQIDRTSQKESHHEAVLCDKFFSATSQMNEQSQDGAYIKPSHDSKRPKEDHLSVGDIVQVEDRTWPGVNKRGGVARITKVHHDTGVTYDVSYVLGGREKQVDSAFVRLHKEPSEESPSILNVIREDASIKSAGSRKSYRVGEKKVVQEWVAQIEKEEELKAKLAERSIDNNVPSTTIKKSVSKPKNSKVKNVIKEEHKESPKTSKKNKINKIKSLSSESDHSDKNHPTVPCATDSITTERNQSNLTKLSYASIIEIALANFNSKLQLNNDSNKPRTLYLTTSSIGKAGEALVKQMISEVNGGVKLKLLKDFNPYKTSILITASSGRSSYGGLISKLRTMKAMRSSLSSIPIVSLEWVRNCISERTVVPLTVDISVTALPTKLECLMSELEPVRLNDARNSQTAALGVLALALLHQGVDEPNQKAATPRLFSNTSVLLCGASWKSSTTKTKDVQLLLREGGGDIITSASQAVKYIEEDLVDKNSPTKFLVLLLDESESDATDGITSNLQNAVQNYFASNKRQGQHHIIVVNMNWLFDSISCASCLDPRLYEPSSSHARSLWNLYFSKDIKCSETMIR